MKSTKVADVVHDVKRKFDYKGYKKIFGNIADAVGFFVV